MKRKRRLHKPEFKARVALAAVQGEMTMAEMVKKFEVQATQITQWKKQLLSGKYPRYWSGIYRCVWQRREGGRRH